METINIVWFKRDLRLSDHEPLKLALQQDRRLLLLYIVEPMQLADPHYDTRHWRFIWQSLADLNRQLTAFDGKILIVEGKAESVFQSLLTQFRIETVYSHQEIGLFNTFKRDRALAQLFKQHQIQWHESPCGAVIRALKSRKTWDEHWQSVMRSPLATPDLSMLNGIKPEAVAELTTFSAPCEWQQKQRGMQTGGPTLAFQTLRDFFNGRGKTYAKSISKPLASRSACSRLSPYLAFGNISLREAYQTILTYWQMPGYRRSLIALVSRLHWHCHFIQKFESECEMEFRPVNRAYLTYPYRTLPDCESDLLAWQQGRTGIPLVDACMRCVYHTGYLNFRMRAMLVSVLTHHLNIDWQLGVTHLAKLFLDFEPGIHYPQFQMQAGVTGANTIRIYNPIKQAQDHDPNGEFIHKWVPELTNVPAPLVFEPHKLTAMEALMYDIPSDSIYLNPIIDLEEAAKHARERLWSYREQFTVKKEAARIVHRHTRAT